MKKEITIRSLTSLQDLISIREIEKKVWSESEIIPIHQTLTAVKNGGLMLGAYYRDKLIGFQYSFAGFNGTYPYLCSHMLAVLSEYRHLGIGEILKREQKEYALKFGYKLITWTFDPLESVNGYLNIGKLGAITSNYIVNCYGNMADKINTGIPTDRLFVNWWIKTEHVNKRLDNRNLAALPQVEQIINPHKEVKKGLPYISQTFYDKIAADFPLYIAIPKNFQKLKEYDSLLAMDWRLKLRDILLAYFSEKWTIVDFCKTEGELVNYYILKKDFKII